MRRMFDGFYPKGEIPPPPKTESMRMLALEINRILRPLENLIVDPGPYYPPDDVTARDPAEMTAIAAQPKVVPDEEYPVFTNALDAFDFFLACMKENTYFPGFKLVYPTDGNN